MAVRFNADADIIYGLYNLGGAGHVNFALGGYFYLLPKYRLSPPRKFNWWVRGFYELGV